MVFVSLLWCSLPERFGFGTYIWGVGGSTPTCRLLEVAQRLGTVRIGLEPGLSCHAAPG